MYQTRSKQKKINLERFDIDKAYGALIEIMKDIHTCMRSCTHTHTHSQVANSMNSLARKLLRRCSLCDYLAGRGDSGWWYKE